MLFRWENESDEFLHPHWAPRLTSERVLSGLTVHIGKSATVLAQTRRPKFIRKLPIRNSDIKAWVIFLEYSGLGEVMNMVTDHSPISTPTLVQLRR